MANEMAFEKTEDKFQVAVKDKDLYLTGSDLLINVFFNDRLKAAVMKLILQIPKLSFFFWFFVSLYIFPCFNGKYFKYLLLKFKTNFPKPQLLNFQIQNPVNKAKSKIQLKHDANVETQQRTKQNDMVTNNNN